MLALFNVTALKDIKNYADLQSTLDLLLKLPNALDPITINAKFAKTISDATRQMRSFITEKNSADVLKYFIPLRNLSNKLSEHVTNNTPVPATLVFSAFYYLGKWDTEKIKLDKYAEFEKFITECNNTKNAIINSSEFDKTITDALDKIINSANPLILKKLMQQLIDSMQTGLIQTTQGGIDGTIKTWEASSTKIKDYAKKIGGVTKNKNIETDLINSTDKLTDFAHAKKLIYQTDDDALKAIPAKKNEASLDNYVKKITDQINSINVAGLNEDATNNLQKTKDDALDDIKQEVDKDRDAIKNRGASWEPVRDAAIDTIWTNIKCSQNLSQTIQSIKSPQAQIVSSLGTTGDISNLWFKKIKTSLITSDEIWTLRKPGNQDILTIYNTELKSLIKNNKITDANNKVYQSFLKLLGCIDPSLLSESYEFNIFTKDPKNLTEAKKYITEVQQAVISYTKERLCGLKKILGKTSKDTEPITKAFKLSNTTESSIKPAFIKELTRLLDALYEAGSEVIFVIKSGYEPTPGKNKITDLFTK